ncbi:MAG: class I cytochrome c [Acidobacteria bacterium OLB17]|nr:MAG: class I cytochrome c [Acidobacteria bacterium OLB17]MCZ2391974.1 heme-binding domain-containing protein [Acidobacteriota bacterium]
MKKALKIGALALAAAFVVLQFFQIDRTNPPVNAVEMLEAAVEVPPDIKIILGRSCNDCHSNTTIYPWYASVQPSAWYVKDHIDDGRRHLNFSVFNTYPLAKKQKKLSEMCEQVRSAEMPLPSYLWIHGDAKMQPGEAEAVCDWTNAAIAALANAPAAE